ncbi:MAG: cysteine desulfurase, partial [Thermoleophilia bacterium]|nr:cysteine desulfurase [Thermoleophilia bacterium]
MEKIIYLDHAATTPVDPEVVAAMLPWFTEQYGNPSTVYSLGLTASQATERARETVAQLLGAQPEEIYFTSGGTEADNWAIQGTADALAHKGRHLITSAIEHHAVLEPMEHLEKRGFTVTRVPVDSQGIVDPDDVRRALRPDTILVSIMHANNEVGTIQPIAEIGRITREAGVLFHTDAVQSAGKLPLNVDELNVDMLSLSA